MDLDKLKQEMEENHKSIMKIICRQENPEHKHILATHYSDWLKMMREIHSII